MTTIDETLQACAAIAPALQRIDAKLSVLSARLESLEKARPESLLTQSDVAALLGTTTRSVRALTEAKEIPLPVRTVGIRPRWSRAELESWMKSKPDPKSQKLRKGKTA